MTQTDIQWHRLQAMIDHAVIPGMPQTATVEEILYPKGKASYPDPEYNVFFNSTNGPYIIERIWYSGPTGTWDGVKLTAIIDGETVVDDLSMHVVDDYLGPQGLTYDFPLIASVSLTLKVRKRYPASSGYSQANAQIKRLSS